MAANSSEPYIIESSQKANALIQWIITIVLFAIALGIYLFLASLGDGRSKGQVGWVLQISAPLPGINYYADFPLEVVAREHAALMRRNLVDDEEETTAG